MNHLSSIAARIGPLLPDDHQMKRLFEKSKLLKRKKDISAQLSIASRRLKD
jgi:hypothetical protein